MIKIKDHDYEELGKLGEKFWKAFVDNIRDKNGHIELKVKCCHEHGVHTLSNEIGSVITEDSINNLAFCEIYYLDEIDCYPEYIFVGMNGTIVVAQDMLHNRGWDWGY